MIWFVTGISGLLAIYVIRTYRRGLYIFSIANSTIVAAITYEALENDGRKAADDILKRYLTLNQRSRETFEGLWQSSREISRWRWYSLAFAHDQIPPGYPGVNKWELCRKNVAHDAWLMLKGTPNFMNKLERREPYEKYLRLLR